MDNLEERRQKALEILGKMQAGLQVYEEVKNPTLPYTWVQRNLKIHLKKRKKLNHLPDKDPKRFDELIKQIFYDVSDLTVYVHDKPDRYVFSAYARASTLDNRERWYVLISDEMRIISVYQGDHNFKNSGDSDQYTQIEIYDTDGEDESFAEAIKEYEKEEAKRQKKKRK